MVDYVLGHKSRLCKVKKSESLSSTFSSHNEEKLDVNYRVKNTIKNINMEAKQHTSE